MPEQGATVLLLISSALLVWAGFALLALCQERHFDCFYASKRPLAPIKRAQAAIVFIAFVAVTCMIAALPLCIKAQGAGFGSLLWVLMLTLAAVSVALQLTWARWCMKPLAWAVHRIFQISQSSPSSRSSSPTSPTR